MSPSFTGTIRRFSRSSSVRSSGDNKDGAARDSSGSRPVSQSQSQPQQQQQSQPDTSNAYVSTPNSYTPPAGTMPNGGAVGGQRVASGASGVPQMQQQQPLPQPQLLQQHHDGSRPQSAATDSSFDFLKKPGYQSGGATGTGTQGGQYYHQPLPGTAIGNLSRTDQIVLRHFWEDKYLANVKRDLHFLKFPFFGQYPSHKDLLPYCEIYHLVKTSPGANIISLGSANGVYIGFELSQGAQLHIDMDDEWTNISHHRVAFKSYDQMLRDPASDATFKAWPKPLTIEFLEEQYNNRWLLDLTGFCWTDESVRELGANAADPSTSAGPGVPHSGTAARHGSGASSGMDGMGVDKL